MDYERLYNIFQSVEENSASEKVKNSKTHFKQIYIHMYYVLMKVGDCQNGIGQGGLQKYLEEYFFMWKFLKTVA